MDIINNGNTQVSKLLDFHLANQIINLFYQEKMKKKQTGKFHFTIENAKYRAGKTICLIETFQIFIIHSFENKAISNLLNETPINYILNSRGLFL